jgi:hypothetical protein
MRWPQAWTLEAKSLVESCEPTILARAVHYLYTKETKSSFAIEVEIPSAKRTERFVAALTRAAKFDTSDHLDLAAETFRGRLLSRAIAQPLRVRYDSRHGASINACSRNKMCNSLARI